MDWHHEPPHWTSEGTRLLVTTAPGTDFWRRTTDGQVRDDGHFYSQDVVGDFVADVSFRGSYAEQYDQAGLMVRLDEETWMKCGVELLDGVQQASVVVTHEFSDWSVEPLVPSPATVWLRVLRHEPTFEVHLSLDGRGYRMIRQFHLTSAEALSVGVMTASPLGQGFTTVFNGFQVGPGPTGGT